MKIGFDLGGVVSKYPSEMKEMMKALIAGGIEVVVITDIPQDKAQELCRKNGITDIVSVSHILSADWGAHQDMCKADVVAREGVTIMIDDRPDYLADPSIPIGLQIVPRPQVPYYHKDWINE